MNDLIPYEVKVSIYALLIITITVFIFSNKKQLDESYFSKYYIYYYIILMANLINMLFVTLVYYTQKQSMYGLPGKKGRIGMKGKMGNEVSCYDSNLTIKKTKMYREILILNVDNEDLSEKYKSLKDNKNSDEYKTFQRNKQIRNYIDNEEKYFNLEFLKDINKTGKSEYYKKYDDEMVTVLNDIFDYEIRMEFLFNYLNKRITNDKRTNQNKLGFYKPIGGNGFFPIGHSVFDVTYNKEDDLQIKMNAFLINGNIRMPEKYKIKLNFTNRDELERQDKAEDATSVNNGLERNNKTGRVFENRRYSILKVEPVKTDKDGKEKIYVPLGELIVRNENTDSKEEYEPTTNLIGCIDIECANKIGLEELELVGVKMSYQSNPINKFFKNETEIEGIGLFSVWKTPLNTFVTNCIGDDIDIINNVSLGYSILNGVKYDDRNNENKFINNGYLNVEGENYIKTILKAIKIPVLIRICYVTINQYILYFNQLEYYMPNTIEEIRIIINENINKLGRASQEKKKELTELNIKLEKKIKRLEKLIKLIKKDESERYKNFTNLFDGDGTNSNNNNNNNNNINNIQPLLQEELPDYDKIQEKLEMIPSIIDSQTTLYDLLILMFPNGFDENIKIDDLNFIQKEIIKICKICFPPNTEIYVPKNECISYETVDLVRRKIIRKLDKTLDRYNLLFRQYGYVSNEIFETHLRKGDIETYLTEKQFKKHCKIDFSKIQEKIKELDELFNGTFGHIPNYKKLIQTQDMELFSNYRIEFIISEYEKIIKFLEDSCNEIPDTDYIDSVELNTNDNST